MGQNFPKTLQKARAPIAANEDFHSVKKEVPGAGTQTLPRNKRGLATSFNTNRNAISSFGESLSGVLTPQSSSIRPNEGPVRPLGKISYDSPNQSPKPRTAAVEQRGSKPSNLGHPTGMGFNDTIAFPRRSNDPGLSNSGAGDPRPRSTMGSPNHGAKPRLGAETSLPGATKQTIMRSKDVREQASHSTNTTNPMPQRRQPLGATDNTLSRDTRGAPKNKKPDTPHDVAQGPEMATRKMQKGGTTNQGPSIPQPHPQKNVITSHKSSTPKEKRGPLNSNISRAVQNVKQGTCLFRNSRGDSNIVRSSEAAQGPDKNTGKHPVQIPERCAVFHPNKNPEKHPAEKPHPQSSYPSIKHGGDHPAEKPHPHSIHPSIKHGRDDPADTSHEHPDHHPDHPRAESLRQSDEVYGHSTDQDYPGGRLLGNETFQSFDVYPSNYGYEVSPYYPDQHFGKDEERTDYESPNDRPNKSFDVQHEESFDSFSYSNNLPAEPEYNGLFPQQGSYEVELPIANYDGYNSESATSFPEPCEPISAEIHGFESLGQYRDNFAEGPSNPYYLMNQSENAEENTCNDWQSQADEEWPRHYLPEEGYVPSNQLTDEVGGYSGEYNPVNYENVSLWEMGASEYQREWPSEDNTLGPEGYAERGYVDEQSNARGRSEESNFGSDTYAFDETEAKLLNGAGGRDPTRDQYEADGRRYEGIVQNLGEDDYGYRNDGDGNQNLYSDPEAEPESYDEEERYGSTQENDDFSGNDDGEPGMSNDGLSNQDDEAGSREEYRGSDEIEGHEDAGDENQQGSYESADEETYDSGYHQQERSILFDEMGTGSNEQHDSGIYDDQPLTNDGDGSGTEDGEYGTERSHQYNASWMNSHGGGMEENHYSDSQDEKGLHTEYPWCGGRGELDEGEEGEGEEGEEGNGFCDDDRSVETEEEEDREDDEDEDNGNDNDDGGNCGTGYESYEGEEEEDGDREGNNIEEDEDGYGEENKSEEEDEDEDLEC
ncbi:hypothetical protein V8E51_014366 [Hyaloscypha variabilis]